MASGPSGRLHLGAVGESRKLLLISAGSGVTPMMSILRYMADTDLAGDIVFHHCTRTVSDIPFLNELQLLEWQLGGRLRLSWNMTGGEPPFDASLHGVVYSGRINAAMMMNICPDLAERSTFCCGPAGFRSTIREICAVCQIGAADAYLEENFGSDLEAEQFPSIGEYSVEFLRSGKLCGEPA
ncbi:hypothetical protein AB4144_19500 [Rhizobiaceae sp. 2RAB30]